MIEYRASADGIDAAMLEGFFDGWRVRPTPEKHLRILRASQHVALALEGEVVVGFATAVSDGVISAYIPLLEVRSGYRRRGIGSELVRRIVAELDLYMVDVCCDASLEAFYTALGFRALDRGMGIRDPSALEASPGV